MSRAATGDDESFGWCCFEGRHEADMTGCSATGKVVPLIEFRHTVPSGEQNCAVTGFNGELYAVNLYSGGAIYRVIGQ